MEGYLEIFGRKFCGKKGNLGLWRRKLFLGEWKHWVQWLFVFHSIIKTQYDLHEIFTFPCSIGLLHG